MENTKLYKAMYECFGGAPEWSTIKDNLQSIYDDIDTCSDFSQERINAAFIFDFTPQGHDYWYRLKRYQTRYLMDAGILINAW